MNNYDFSTLNDKEFEEISKDLLNAKFDFKLQSFRKGKDKGIDLRYSTKRNSNSLVVQAKHYSNSKYSDLKSVVKRKEVKNVKELNPDRYILVTSLSLSAVQKDELKLLLNPFVKTSNDVIGQEDLNDYISEFEYIEKKYYKLWLSSTNIISFILNNAVESRTRYFLKRLKEKIKYYVITEKLELAKNILKEENILLITGQPGIGKTSLAEMVLFDRAKNDFKIHKVVDINEAEDVISNDDNEKQMFYFDDFLGANYAEIINSHKVETQLTSFVERIRNTPNKYLVLTTRTVVLNLASSKYEKINHSSLNERQFELKLSDYSRYEKALILYNHCFHKNLDEKFYEVILEEKFYWVIIKHKNYTPRIIEFITDRSKIKDFNLSEYKQFVLNNLNNPKEIWRFSFNNQITYLERCLLMTLFSFGNNVSEKKLIKAFEERIKFEIKQNNQIVDGNQFTKSIKLLLNGFISSTLYTSDAKNTRSYNFLNPSLADFLIGQAFESYAERKAIIKSLVFLEQLNRFNPKKSIIPIDKELQIEIRDAIINDKFKQDKISFESSNQILGYHSKILSILSTYCLEVNIDNIFLGHLKKLDYSLVWNYTVFSEILNSILIIKDCPQTENYIKEKFLIIAEKIMLTADSDYEAEEVRTLFEKYEQDFEKYSQTEKGKDVIVEMIDNIVLQAEEDYTDSIKSEVLELDKVQETYSELSGLRETLINDICPDYKDHLFETPKLDEDYWKDLIEENQIKIEMREDERWEEHQYRKANPEDFKSSDEDRVDGLFS